MTEGEFSEFINELEAPRWERLIEPQLPPHLLPTQIINNVVTSPNEPIPDCVTCGACCFYFPVVSVGINDITTREHYVEIMREGERGEYLVDRFVKRNVEKGCCAELDGEVGVRGICKIYEQRPYPCRRFDAGSDKCHGIRRMFGIEPPLSPFEMMMATKNLLEYQADSNATETIDEVQIREQTGTDKLEITAFIADGSHQKIYEYNPNEEFWIQSEFESLTLAEARELISSRQQFNKH